MEHLEQYSPEHIRHCFKQPWQLKASQYLHCSKVDRAPRTEQDLH